MSIVSAGSIASHLKIANDASTKALPLVMTVFDALHSIADDGLICGDARKHARQAKAAIAALVLAIERAQAVDHDAVLRNVARPRCVLRPKEE